MLSEVLLHEVIYIFHFRLIRWEHRRIPLAILSSNEWDIAIVLICKLRFFIFYLPSHITTLSHISESLNTSTKLRRLFGCYLLLVYYTRAHVRSLLQHVSDVCGIRTLASYRNFRHESVPYFNV